MSDILESANTGLDAIKRAPIVSYDSGIKCLRIQDISQEKNFEDWGFCEVEQKNYEKFQLKKGDIIVARTGATIGVNRFISQDLKSVYNNGLIRLRTDKAECLPKFLFYNLRTNNYKGFIESISGGTSTQPNMQINALISFDMLLPDKEEQEAVVDILSSLDDKIDLLHRQNQTLEHMAETLFRQWFVERKGLNHDSNDFPDNLDSKNQGNQANQKNQGSDNVEEADKRWEDCTIEDLCTRITSGGTPSTKNESFYGGTINWYSTKELQDNYLIESEKTITKEGLNNSSAKLFPKNTVIIAIYAAPTVGRLGILQNEASFNQAACGLIADEEICCFEFLFIYLKIQRDELNAMASGSAQQNLNVKKIKDFPAFKVDKTTMNSFSSAVRPVFEKIETNYLQIRTLTALRDTLLPKLMSGEVKVEMGKTTNG